MALLETDCDEAIERYRRHLPPGELQLFSVSGLDHLEVEAVASCFWPERGARGGSHGYGANSAEANASALGELTEASAAERWLQQTERRRASYRDMVQRLGAAQVIDPVTLCLPAGCDYSPERPFDWVPIRRVRSVAELKRSPAPREADENSWIPVEFVANNPGQLAALPLITTPITNGLGAGLNLAQALNHGLLELLQRDGNGLSFRALDRGVAVDLDAVQAADNRALLQHLDDQGIAVQVKLASDEFGLANLYVVGCERNLARLDAQPLMVTACGEAAYPDRERALRKALLEFAAARLRKAFAHGPLEAVRQATPAGYLDRWLSEQSLEGEEPRALEAMMEWCQQSASTLYGRINATVLHHSRRVAFSTLPEDAALREADAWSLLAALVERLTKAGFEIYFADFSPPGEEVFALKAIVPGLEVETMSYYRIGERGVAKLLARQSPLAGVGNPPSHGACIWLPEEGYERLGGTPWLDRRAVDAMVGPLYPLYREPGRHAAQLALGHYPLPADEAP